MKIIADWEFGKVLATWAMLALMVVAPAGAIGYRFGVQAGQRSAKEITVAKDDGISVTVRNNGNSSSAIPSLTVPFAGTAIHEQFTCVAGDVVKGTIATVPVVKNCEDAGPDDLTCFGDGAEKIFKTNPWIQAEAGIVLSGGIGPVPASSTVYVAKVGNPRYNFTEADAGTKFPRALRLGDLCVRTMAVQSSSGGMDVTVQKNFTATALTVHVPKGSRAGKDYCSPKGIKVPCKANSDVWDIQVWNDAAVQSSMPRITVGIE